MSGSSEHIVSAVDDDLAELDHKIAEMGGLAERQLEEAIRALRGGDSEIVQGVLAMDRKVDELEHEVDRLIIRFLALRQPMADDLRAILGAHKIATYIERMGDYAKNIAKRSIALQDPSVLSGATGSIARMAHVVQAMIGDVLSAYVARDVTRADDVRMRDSEVDQLNTSLFRELLTYMMEDPRSISACTHLLFVAKNLERMGDHATGIAEQVHFIVTGEVPPDDRPKRDRSSVTVLGPE